VRKPTAICVALALGGIPFGVAACGSDTPQRTASTQATAPPTETSLPTLKEGYLDGPAEYTDHGWRIRLDAEQASTPISEEKGKLSFSVVPIQYAHEETLSEAEAEEYKEEKVPVKVLTKDNEDVSVNLAANGFIGEDIPNVVSCATKGEEEGIQAQWCVFLTSDSEAMGVYDQSAHLLASQTRTHDTEKIDLLALREELVGLFPAVFAQQIVTQTEKHKEEEKQEKEDRQTTERDEAAKEREIRARAKADEAEAARSREAAHSQQEAQEAQMAKERTEQASGPGSMNKYPGETCVGPGEQEYKCSAAQKSESSPASRALGR
jgi:hypothetical protein